MDVVHYLKSSIGLYFEKKTENYKYIDKKVSWMEGFLTFFILTIVSYISSYLIDTAFQTQDIMGGNLFIITFIVLMILFPLFIFASYGLLHLLFLLFGGKGKFKETLKFGVSTSIFPSLVFLALGLIPSFLFASRTYAIVFSIIFLTVALVLMIWSLIVTAKIYSRVHKISFGKSMIVLLIPLAVFIILFFLFVIIIQAML